MAAELGVTSRRVIAYASRGCPSTLETDGVRRRLWDIDEVKAWLEAEGITGKTGPTPREPRPEASRIEAAKARKEEALAEKHEIELDLLRRSVVPRADVEATRVAQIHQLKSDLLGPGHVRRLAQQLEGRRAREMVSILEGWLRLRVEAYAAGTVL